MLNHKLIICCGARANSKRIPDKNTRLLNGKSLIERTILSSRELKLPFYLSSDSDAILAIGKKLNVHCIKRPENIALDNSPDELWLIHLVREFYLQNNYYPTDLVFLRPTTPFRQPLVLKEAIQTYLVNNYYSMRSVEPISEAPEKTYKIKNGYLTPAIAGISFEQTNAPNQIFDQTYKANGYIDIINTTDLLTWNRVYNPQCKPFVTENTIEIDTEDNWSQAEYIAKGIENELIE